VNVDARTWTACLAAFALVACGSARPTPAPPPPPAAEEPEPATDDGDAGADDIAEDASAPIVDAPERTRAPSTASYDEALSTPEPLNANDSRLHLTDLQLTNPLRGVLGGCRVPPKAKVTVKTVVQEGRAIGVTVIVRFDKPKPKSPPKKPPKPPSKAAQKAEAKKIATITACVDQAVRMTIWPPSHRRDSFTMEF
jgi:hypothetical protein